MFGQFETFSEFLAMGKHGIHVWSSYALFLAVVIFNLVSIRMKRISFLKQEKQRMRRDGSSSASDTSGESHASKA